MTPDLAWRPLILDCEFDPATQQARNEDQEKIKGDLEPTQGLQQRDHFWSAIKGVRRWDQ